MAADRSNLISLMCTRRKQFSRPTHNPITALLHVVTMARLAKLAADLATYEFLRNAEATPRTEHWREQAEARIRDGVAWLRAA